MSCQPHRVTSGQMQKNKNLEQICLVVFRAPIPRFYYYYDDDDNYYYYYYSCYYYYYYSC